MVPQIKEKIGYLRRLAYEHTNKYQPIENVQYLPLKEEEIQNFEQRNNITLPSEYRDYLLYIANGGLGSQNGIVPLNPQQIIPNIYLPWIDPVAYNEIFRYNYEHEDYDTFLARVDAIDREEESDALTMDENYENGILYLTDMGCGMYSFLVINGPHKGEIWTNATVNDNGFAYNAPNFLVWLEKWLDQKIEQLQKKNSNFKVVVPTMDTNTDVEKKKLFLEAKTLVGLGKFKDAVKYLETALALKNKDFDRMFWKKSLSNRCTIATLN